MLYRINWVLGIMLVAIFVLLSFMQVDHSRPNYQVNLGDDMTYSPAYGSFESNSHFANGRTMQSPVQNTIAFGAQIFHYEATTQDALLAGQELINPTALDTVVGAAAADRGSEVFKTFCVVCHGGDGTGNGPVAKRGFPPPPSLLIGKSREMKDGQLFHILTYGQNSMPEFAAQISPARRWEVINHIRRLQKTAPPLDEATSVAVQASTESESNEEPNAATKAAVESIDKSVKTIIEPESKKTTENDATKTDAAEKLPNRRGNKP